MLIRRWEVPTNSTIIEPPRHLMIPQYYILGPIHERPKIFIFQRPIYSPRVLQIRITSAPNVGSWFKIVMSAPNSIFFFYVPKSVFLCNVLNVLSASYFNKIKQGHRNKANRSIICRLFIHQSINTVFDIHQTIRQVSTEFTLSKLTSTTPRLSHKGCGSFLHVTFACHMVKGKWFCSRSVK